MTSPSVIVLETDPAQPLPTRAIETARDLVGRARPGRVVVRPRRARTDRSVKRTRLRRFAPYVLVVVTAAGVATVVLFFTRRARDRAPGADVTMGEPGSKQAAQTAEALEPAASVF